MSSKAKIIALILSSAMAMNAYCAEMSSKDAPKEKAKPVNAKVEFVQKLQNLLNSGDLDAAIASFDSLSDENTKDSDLMLIKASLLISSGKTSDALKVLDALEENDPSNIEVLEMKIVAAKAQGSKGTSAKKAAISKVIALDPNNATANIELAQEQVINHKYKFARNYYKKALNSSPKDLGALFGYGQTSYYLNDIDEARIAFKKMLALNPNAAIAYQYLGKLEAEDENYKAALEYINKAIEIEDDNYDFYMDLGTYSRYRGKFADAEKAWTKAISINPDYFLAYTYRAGLYDEQNKLDLALNDYRKVVETNPKYYFAYEALGILAWHAESYDEARKAFETAYSYNKENVSYPLMIAACYIKAGQLQKAKLFLQQVMKGMADKQTVEFSMVRLYHDQGPGNAENDLAIKIPKIDKTTPKGKMLFYFALYYDLKGVNTLAAKYYAEVKNMNSPMFFEYRLAEWSLEK